jgi:glutamate synthase domain-containing protein 3
MTNGVVVILGAVSYNVGAGMTGGVVFLPHVAARFVNTEYVRSSELNADDEEMLRTLLNGYMQATGSTSARRFLEQPRLGEMLCKYLPVGGVSAVSAKAGARAA